MTLTKYKLTPKLGSILKERDIKQIHIANDAGVPQPFISRFDSTTRTNYDISSLYSIATVLGLRIEDLFTIEEVPDNDKKTPE
jgi:transcriptional regulator with XRE-family HTH domain